MICRPVGTDTPAWLEPLLSKWGSDMAMRSGQPLGGTGNFAALLAPEQFVLADHRDVDFDSGEVIPSILRDVLLQSPTGSESRNVDIALLEPKFDPGAGLWFCDVDFKNAPAFKIDLDLAFPDTNITLSRAATSLSPLLPAASCCTSRGRLRRHEATIASISRSSDQLTRNARP